MSTIPRTPVHFPRMKVRGKRNKAKLAARHETWHVIANAAVGRNPDGTYSLCARPAVGHILGHRVEFSETRDGYGRLVKRRPEPKPKPKPPAFSMSLTFDQPIAEDLWSILTGGG